MQGGRRAVFTARLIGTGNMVLLHPMEEDGQTFLPCCYGNATKISRAQGSSLDYGCLSSRRHHVGRHHAGQRRHHAGRGYGYVGASRFRLFSVWEASPDGLPPRGPRVGG